MRSDRNALTCHYLAPALAISALLGVGCGDGVRYATVKGVISDSEGPVEGVRVLFDPVSVPPGHSSAGVTNADGVYTLVAVESGRPGAVVGKNRVMLSFGLPSESDDELTPLPTRQVPLEFRDGSTVFEVPAEGEESADFQFSSRRKR